MTHIDTPRHLPDRRAMIFDCKGFPSMVEDEDNSCGAQQPDHNHESFTGDSLTSSSRDGGHSASLSCSRRFAFFNIPENDIDNDNAHTNTIMESLHTPISVLDFSDRSVAYNSRGSLPSLNSVQESDTIVGRLSEHSASVGLGFEEASVVGSRGSLPSLDSILENDTLGESNNLSRILFQYLSLSLETSSNHSSIGSKRRLEACELEQLCPVLDKETERMSQKQRPPVDCKHT